MTPAAETATPLAPVLFVTARIGPALTPTSASCTLRFRGEAAVPAPLKVAPCCTAGSAAVVCTVLSGNLKPRPAVAIRKSPPATVSFEVGALVPTPTLPTPTGARSTLPAGPAAPAPAPAEPGCKVIDPPLPLAEPAGALPPLPAVRTMGAPVPASCPVAPVVLPPLPFVVCNSAAAFVPLPTDASGCAWLTCKVAEGVASLTPTRPASSVMTELV